MANDIVGKIKLFLREPIDSECKVVYLLAQVRKLLERDDPDHKMADLWMLCHWAIHMDLERPGTTRVFLDRVDRWVMEKIPYLTPRGPAAPEEDFDLRKEFDLYKDFLDLRTFKDQLRKFLEARELPTTLCDDGDR